VIDMPDTKPLLLNLAMLCHAGALRQSNEDCAAIGAVVLETFMTGPESMTLPLTQARVCLIADGMGGHPAGEVASRLAVEALIGELPAAHASDEAVCAAVRSANRAIFEAMAENPGWLGMGTTIAGITADENSVCVFNVGDSRIYQVIDGAVEQISIDHTEIDTPSVLTWIPPVRMLSQCLGGYPDFNEIAPHVTRLTTQPGLQLLICSDGLHDMLSDNEIAHCLGTDLARAVQTMFERAMGAGGRDNISIILARFEHATA
jgi:serine/threonine protein phosphatase PrpC